jgi:RimJ/RimL family protein N-acetyltransferase
MLWKLVNDPDVRASSFSPRPIPWAEHEMWFGKKMKDPSCRIYIAVDPHGEAIGQLRVDMLSSQDGEIAVSLLQQYRGKGYGTLLIDLGVHRAFVELGAQRIHAYVMAGNEVSLRSFATAGFTVLGGEQVNGHDAVHFVRLNTSRVLRRSPDVQIAIAQPTYLPWLGYFDLIDQVDHFILLDSVQFEKQSWQQRNRIKTPTGLQWITVPVVFRGRLSQQIKDVEIREPNFWRNHLRAIELSYGRSPFFGQYFPELSEMLRQGGPGRLLSELNIQLIAWFCKTLGIPTPMTCSSTMHQDGRRTSLLVNLCRSLNADSYLSPIGSANYLMADLPLFKEEDIDVYFQRYEHPEYSQLFPPFCPYASALDLVFNEGPRAMEIIRSGRAKAWLPSEIAVLQN